MLRLIVSVIFAISIVSHTAAQAPPSETQVNAAMNNLVSECLECFNYFSIAISGMSRRTDAAKNRQIIERYRGAANRLLEYAYTTGQQIGMTQDGLVARGKLIGQDLRQQMGNSMTNISVLILKYQKPCNELLAKPMNRLNALIAKELQR